MKNNRLWILVLGIFLGYSAPLWADAPSFPVSFTTSYVDQNTNTLIKVEDAKLRISVSSLEGESIQDYSMDIEQNTIAASPGDIVSKDSDGWRSVYDAVVASLTSAKEGLEESGDTEASESLGTTLTYLQSLA